MDEYEEGGRKPFITSRQMGLAAAFGAAAFAFRALGIAIPMVPPLVIGPGALMPILAGMAGGPIVGIIVGIARGIPSGLPHVDLILQPIKGIYWAYVYKYVVLKIEDEKKRWIVFWILIWLLQFFIEATLFTLALVLLGIYGSFYPTWPILFGWYYTLYGIFQIVIFSAIVAALPDIFGWTEGEAPW